MQWEADYVQAAAFLPPTGVHADAIGIWGRIFPGDTPDGFQKAAASPNLLSTASGERNGLQVAVNAQIGRIDLNINPGSTVVAARHGGSVPPRIADVPRAVATAAEYLKIMTKIGGAIRLALILDLAQTIPRNADAQAFAEAVPGVFMPEGALDTVYQFNARKTSYVSDAVELNRLFTVSAGDVGFVSGANVGAQQGNVIKMSRYLGFKIDVNTVAETRPTAALMDAQIDELANEALQIYSKGLEHFK